MKAIFDDRQWAHDPKMFMANGTMSPNPEQPRRIEVLSQAATAAGCVFETPADHGLGPIAAIHSPEYLVFLENIHTRWSRIEGASDEVIPNIHPDRRTASYPRCRRTGRFPPGRHVLSDRRRNMAIGLLVGADSAERCRRSARR